jgi:hypothetical protein
VTGGIVIGSVHGRLRNTNLPQPVATCMRRHTYFTLTLTESRYLHTTEFWEHFHPLTCMPDKSKLLEVYCRARRACSTNGGEEECM